VRRPSLSDASSAVWYAKAETTATRVAAANQETRPSELVVARPLNLELLRGVPPLGSGDQEFTISPTRDRSSGTGPSIMKTMTLAFFRR
jgi:hypothetical protein